MIARTMASKTATTAPRRIRMGTVLPPNACVNRSAATDASPGTKPHLGGSG